MSPERSSGEPDRLEVARDFWERSARQDHRRAIWDSAALHGEEGIAAFEEAGRSEAERLTWFVPPGSTVLDLGCGSGRVMRPLAARCREILGFDISPTMIEEAARYLEGTPNARLHLTGGASL